MDFWGIVKVGNRDTMLVDGADTHRYSYDKVYQLTDANYPGTAITEYYYDALGNCCKLDVNDGGKITGHSSKGTAYLYRPIIVFSKELVIWI